MWRSFVWKKDFDKDEKEKVSNLCKIGNTIWKQNMVFERREVELFRRTDRAMIRAMCGVKLIDQKNTKINANVGYYRIY